MDHCFPDSKITILIQNSSKLLKHNPAVPELTILFHLFFSLDIPCLLTHISFPHVFLFFIVFNFIFSSEYTNHLESKCNCLVHFLWDLLVHKLLKKQQPYPRGILLISLFYFVLVRKGTPLSPSHSNQIYKSHFLVFVRVNSFVWQNFCSL